jgi:enoyl-CoA hydratase/carnithine racemase
MTTSDLVRSERHGAAVVLTFDRPEKLNALNTPLLHRLERVLDEAERDADVRVIVLTGAGQKSFVAGADIGEYAELDEAAFDEYQRYSRRLFSKIDRFPKPVIGAVNGYALGGGFEIALCCDVLVASGNARFGLPEGLLGLSPGGGGTQRLTRAVGPFVAADVLLSTRRLSAEDALRLGLVAEVVEPERLLDTALAKAEAMAKVAPLASSGMLRLIEAAGDAPLEEGLTLEQEALSRLRRSEDAAEGIEAFVAKREPRFRGA